MVIYIFILIYFFIITSDIFFANIIKKKRLTHLKWSLLTEKKEGDDCTCCSNLMSICFPSNQGLVQSQSYMKWWPKSLKQRDAQFRKFIHGPNMHTFADNFTLYLPKQYGTVSFSMPGKLKVKSDVFFCPLQTWP